MNSELQKAIRSLGFRLLLLHTGSFVSLFFLSMYSTSTLKKDLAIQVAEMCRRSIVVGDNRQSILFLESVVPKNFHTASIVSADNRSLFTVPISVDETILNSKLISTISMATIQIPLSYDIKELDHFAVIEFKYSRFEGVYLAIGIWILFLIISIPLMRQAKLNILKRFEKESEVFQHQAISKIVSQVSHDIRSPLAALTVAVRSLSELPQEKRVLISAATDRIKEIANNLLLMNKPEIKDVKSTPIELPLELSEQMVLGIVDSIVAEKRAQYRASQQVQLHFDSNFGYGLFTKLNSSEFKRVLSNIIDNAVESLTGKGEIKLTICCYQETIQILIKDTGIGIPDSVLKMLGARGMTYGKLGGSGLGLYHAFETIRKFNGQLLITSKVGFGTEVKILLPVASPPKWYVSEILIPEMSSVVVLDDDPSVHELWKHRLHDVLRAKKSELVHFYTNKQIRPFLNQAYGSKKNSLYLLDLEIDSSRFGLDFIEEYNLQNMALLVTSYADELKVQEQCIQMRVGLIPKSMAALVPIS